MKEGELTLVSNIRLNYPAPIAPAGDPPPDQGDAKSRLLRAASELIAEKGFDKASLRQITAAAGTNLAAVNYHFGSRESLIDALITSYVKPINARRLEQLTALEEEHAPTPVPLEEIFTAFIEPIITQAEPGSGSARLFYKMLGRCMSERSYRLPEAVLPSLREMTGRFSQAMQRVLPHLSEAAILWRLHFAFGVIAHTLIHAETLGEITNGRSGRAEPRLILQRLREFCLAGLQAPSPETPTPATPPQ